MEKRWRVIYCSSVIQWLCDISTDDSYLKIIKNKDDDYVLHHKRHDSTCFSKLIDTSRRLMSVCKGTP